MYKSKRQEFKYNISYNNNAIITILRPIQNPGIFNTQGIFKTLSNIYDEPCDSQNSLYNHAIFRTLAYLELEDSSKVCRACKMVRHIHNPCIVRKVYSSIFKDIYGYLGIWMHIQSHSGIILFAKHFVLNVCNLYIDICYVLHQIQSEFWHIQNSVYSGIFRHIQAYSALLRHIQPQSQLRKQGNPV